MNNAKSEKDGEKERVEYMKYSSSGALVSLICRDDRQKNLNPNHSFWHIKKTFLKDNYQFVYGKIP